MILRLIEIALALGVIYALITQIVIPGFTGGRLFPWFTNPDARKVEAEAGKVAALRDEVDVKAQLATLSAEKSKLEQKLGEATACADGNTASTDTPSADSTK